MAYRAKLPITLGSVISTTVDLTAVVPSAQSSTGMNRICPDHHLKLKQVNRCPKDDHIVDTFALALDTPQGWVIPKADDKPVPVTAKALELTPVPAKELDDNTFYGDNIYYLEPSTAVGIQGWQVILDIVAKGKVALIAKACLRGGTLEKMWRVTMFRDFLVLRELVWPHEIRQAPEVPRVKVSREVAGLVQTFVNDLSTSWDKVDTSSSTQEEFEAWLAKGVTVTKPEAPEQPKADIPPVTDLLEALKKAVGHR